MVFYLFQFQEVTSNGKYLHSKKAESFFIFILQPTDMRKTLLLILISTFTLCLSAQKTYIWCGTLIDGISNDTKKNMTIVVEKNKILSVENGFTNAGAADKTIDLKTKTVTPGWIDCHVHLEEETNPNRYLQEFTMNPADYAFQSVVFSERTLMAGFTTVRDLGGTGVNISLRNAINKGLIKGPRVYTAGKAIASTGGHADPTNGYRADLMGDPGPKDGVANGPDECRKAVRERYKEGSDLIKIDRKSTRLNSSHE